MSEARKRPMRACTVRTPSRLAPLAPTVQRSTPQKGKPGSIEEPTSLLDSASEEAVPAEKDRLELRSMWELASVINFINTFRSILLLKNFTVEELETAILTCNNLLADVHIALLKGIHPPSRIATSRDNWITVLYKKLKDRWTKVAEPPFPLSSAHGNEAVIYNGLDSPVKLIILKALCEIRLDQEDVRALMDESVKKGNLSSFRKERTGANLIGVLYWYENDSISGHRLYKEQLPLKGKEFRGRAASPPPPSQWETLASNLEEFRAVSDSLLCSKFKQEIGLGRRLKQEVLPVLEAIQKKKDRAHKRQQRQANLLNSQLQANGGTGGRSKRDRKPVNYTFDDYDRSISEAIKFTRKRPQSPERPAELIKDGHTVLANGHSEIAKSQHKRRLVASLSDHLDEHDDVDSRQGDSDSSEGPAVSNDREFSDESNHHTLSPRSRRRRTRPQRYNENDIADAAADTDLDSDDEIEGEAIYDDDFVRSRKRRRRGYASSADDDEYRGNEAEEEEEPDIDDDEEEVGVSNSEDAEEQELEEEPEREKKRYLSRSSRTTRKVKAMEDLGLRRSKRVTRSKVDYKKFENSEEEAEEEDEEEDEVEIHHGGRQSMNGRTKGSVRSFEEADFGADSDAQEPTSSRTQKSGNSAVSGDSEGQDAGSRDDEEEMHRMNGDGGLGRKQLRFLDLNQCATADSPKDWLLMNSKSFPDENITPPG